MKHDITTLQNKIIELMKSQKGFSIKSWGFSAMGHRDVAKHLGISSASASNCMRSLYKSGVFMNKTSQNQWDQSTYYLPNLSYEKSKNNREKH